MPPFAKLATVLPENKFSMQDLTVSFYNVYHTQPTVFTLSIRTPQLLTIYVLKFEPVQFTTQCCV